MTDVAKPKKRQIKASVSKDASTENTDSVVEETTNVANTEASAEGTTQQQNQVQKFDISQMTPATAAIALIEGVELAQKAGIYSLDDAEVLSAARRILLSAIRVNNG